MKRVGRRFVLFWVMALLLAGSASANSAPPDYLVAVRVANGPGEPYLLEILAEGERDGDFVDESLDPALLERLRGAVPEGWHGCTLGSGIDGRVEGDLVGEDGNHRFRGYSLPREFRVLMVTESGESWVSDVLVRETLQVGVRVDWRDRTAEVPPVWGAFALQLVSTLLPTLVFEGLVLLLFEYDWRKNWKTFLLVNLVTQGGLAAFLSRIVVRSGLGSYSALIYFLFLIPVELGIFVVEAMVYRRFLKGHSKIRAVGCAAAANLVSYVAGWFVVQAVWDNITRALWLGV